ncbi:MAG: TRAP transporter small permease [Deltaproteobacteria bacterium]|nr:TRAP transporter small permease [Deltaproteobacteria bacterium]
MKVSIEFLESILAKINKFFVFIACLMYVGTILLINFDLFMRFAFRAPIAGLTEVTEIFLLYMTFLGAAWLYKDDGHVVVDIVLYNLVSKSLAKKILILQNHIIVGIISGILVYYGSLTTFDHYMRGAYNPTILETPIALAIAIIPVGSFILLLEVLVKIFNIGYRPKIVDPIK